MQTRYLVFTSLFHSFTSFFGLVLFLIYEIDEYMLTNRRLSVLKQVTTWFEPCLQELASRAQKSGFVIKGYVLVGDAENFGA